MRLVWAVVIATCGMELAGPLRADVLRVAPIIFTAMTHTDGRYATDRQFQDEVARIRSGLALFGPVRMNLEASKEFAARDKAISTSTGLPTFLQTVVDDGHGVGTHCNDVRADADPAIAPLLAEIIAANKTAVDAALDNPANNVSISGICSRQDWVTASATAGFRITDASVGLCYLTVPLADRPTPAWTNGVIMDTYFHDPAPLYFANRRSPIRLADAADFIEDAAGILTLSNGELGELASLSEHRVACGPCTLDQDDLEIVYAAIERLRLQKRPDEVGRINIHVPTSLFTPANLAMMQAFVQRLTAYADAGTIVFGTQKDVADTYDSWR